MDDDAGEVYRVRAAEAEREAGELGHTLARVVNLRLLTFLLAVAGGALAVWRDWPLLLLPAGAALLAFGELVRRHGRLSLRHRRAVVRRQINEEALLRLARDWDGLPAPAPPVPPDHPYAADLDVAGRASLLQLLDTTTTPMGSSTLAGWLLAPAQP